MLNQNFYEKVVMQSSQFEPVSSPCGGVTRTLLERSEDSEYAISTTLVEFQPNSHFDEHIHDHGEELFVIEGTFSDEHGDYPEGTYAYFLTFEENDFNAPAYPYIFGPSTKQQRGA